MDQRAIESACARYQLRRDLRRVRGLPGQVRGAGVGSSVEFHDYRRYLPGDDPRHVDWAVYGRTGELNVRLFEEEVHPTLDVLLDGSRSMAIDDGRKGALALELAAFALHSARAQGGQARLVLCGETLRLQPPLTEVRLDAAQSLLLSDPARCTRQLRATGMRVLISDFMSGQAERSIAQLSRGAAQLLVIMTLGPWEAAPRGAPLLTLADAESAQELSTALGERALTRYRQRLSAIERAARDTCRALGGSFVRVVCDRPLLSVLREDLLPAGAVEPGTRVGA